MVLDKQIVHWFDFLTTMTQKELRARYKNTAAGFLWVLINPLLQMVVIGVIFSHFVQFKGSNYFIYLFSGLLPWNFFSMTVSKATTAFVFERYLIQKAKFPKESIVLSIVLSTFVNFLISLGLFCLVLAVCFGAQLSTLSSLILPVIWLLLLTTGISLLTSSLNVRFRDVTFITQALMPLWFYGTPIAYTLDLLPNYLKTFLYFNPILLVIELFHHSILGEAIVDPLRLMPSVLTGLVLSATGLLVYLRFQINFDDWL